MPNFINTGTIRLQDGRLGDTVPLNLSFSLPAQTLVNGQALLVLYDLEQYKEHQVNLPNGEIGEVFFRGQQTVFSAPPEHIVEPGSGILFMAQVTFAPRPQGGSGATLDSFVQKLAKIGKIAAPAFNLEIRCLSSVDAQGNTLSPQVIDRRAIVVTGPAQADFEHFTASGDAKRKLTLRLLSLDRTRVLVSQLNPQHCFANSPVFITYNASRARQHVNRRAPAPANAPPLPPPKRLGDITGEYAELSSPNAKLANGNGVLTPAVLRVHHVGSAVCGWYSPLPSFVLAAKAPSTTKTVGRPLFPDPVPKLSPQRGVFVLGRNIPGTTKFLAEFVFRGNANGQDELDPDFLVAVPDLGPNPPNLPPPVQPSERLVVHIDFEPADRPLEESPERIRVSFPPTFLRADVVFARISDRSRLSWQAIHALRTDSNTPGVLQGNVEKQLVEELVEPLPPAVKGALISSIISPEMDALIVEVSRGTRFQRTAPIGNVNAALRNLAASLRSVSGSPTGNARLSPELIAEVREVARLHTLQFDGATTDMLSALQLISDEVIEAVLVVKDPNHKPGRLPVAADLETIMLEMERNNTFDGFAAFNIRPAGGVVYRLEFLANQSGSREFIVLSGTMGGFVVKVSKLDAVTKAPLETPPDEGPFPQVYAGSLIGGAVGKGIKLKPGAGGVKKTAGATIGPMTVDIPSFSNLQPSAFDGASFWILAAGASVAGSVLPGKASAKALDVMWSLTTTSVPPVTLEVEIKKGLEREAKLLSGGEILKKLVELAKAVAQGKPASVAEASAAVTAVSLVHGRLSLQLTTTKGRAKRPTQSIAQHQPIDFNTRIADARFDLGSAEVTAQMRQYLHLRLAVQRKLLEYPGWLDIEGLASPEWTSADRTTAAQLNQDLSARRANAVLDAIFDAVGNPGDGIFPEEKDINVQGKGSQPFDREFSPNPRAGQHLDVFTPIPAGQEAAVTADREQFLPTLRRVDIAMNAVFTLRLAAAPGSVTE